MQFSVPIRGNQKLAQLIENIQSSQKLKGLWTVANVNAIDRMSINDHGPVHSKIVANSALKLFRIITQSAAEASIAANYDDFVEEDGELVLASAAALHDLGHVVHREQHEAFTIALADRIIPLLLRDIYTDYQQAVITGEILHAIFAHKTEVEPLTLEGGILKVADALDMEEGRARIPFQEGEVTIHSVSAMSIEEVSIKKGSQKPVRIQIRISNSAGIFQLDNLFRPKLAHSGLQPYIETKVKVRGEGEAEKKIVDEYEL